MNTSRLARLLALGLAVSPCGCADRLEGTPRDEEQAITPIEAAPEPAPPSPKAAAEARAPEPQEPAPEPEPEPEPPPPPTAEEIAALLAEADAAFEALGVKLDRRPRPRGSLPSESGLREAYAEGRALNVGGRFEQVRQWAALAKFGSVAPGARLGSSALARYDLIVVADAKRDGDSAYIHVLVPTAGLAPEGQRGEHLAWVGKERWVNLADSLTPGVDYLPFKTNGNESLHRQWGRVETIESIAQIVAAYRERTGLPLGIGDISHVTGGKIEDHWTHREGVDVDLYLIDPDERDAEGRPRVWWSHVKRGACTWTSEEKGKGQREPPSDPSDASSPTPTALRLEALAEVVLPIDAVAYFVHNDTQVLARFDEAAGKRRSGRRYLHADNRGYWPTHADHVHLRWVEGKLPTGTPKP